jgi:hypothetical protein
LTTPNGESGRASIEVTGGCPMCSRSRRGPVFHMGKCPFTFPVGHMDTNSLDSRDSTIFCTVAEPVEVGDLVLLVDTGDGDDSPFATWGRVLQVHDRPYVTLRTVGAEGPGRGYTYVGDSPSHRSWAAQWDDANGGRDAS